MPARQAYAIAALAIAVTTLTSIAYVVRGASLHRAEDLARIMLEHDVIDVSRYNTVIAGGGTTQALSPTRTALGAPLVEDCRTVAEGFVRPLGLMWYCTLAVAGVAGIGTVLLGVCAARASACKPNRDDDAGLRQ
jgi:hypothetical protein